jgi:membrane-associated phospholipid phosphatase
MQKRCTVIILALTSMISASAVAGAQTTEHPDAVALFPVVSPVAQPLFTPDALDTAIAQQPAGPPPTPRHTGIKALATHLVTNFKYLPSKENLLWAGAGGGLALAVHPFDDNVNEALVGNDTAEKIFKPGEILGELGTLLGSASVVYAVGRIKDQPKVSHLGMDLIEALAMSEALTQTLKYTTRRERPDGSGKTSFPSGHAADTFAFATALERHLNWKYSIPAYVFSSYVALSRLPANRHWLSDAVFGSAVGIIAVMYTRQSR